MRNSLGKLCVILGAILILFSAAFLSVSLVLRDTDYIEAQYRQRDVDDLMGMSTPDLAGATETLLEYMRGERATIKYSAKVNGEPLDDIFYHEKEVVHMEEVQGLWHGLYVFARCGAVAGALLIGAALLLIEAGKKRALLSSGLFWALGIFGGVIAFFGIWAVLDFDSFWTVFHFLIFPGSLVKYLSAGATPDAMNALNWVLSNDSIMVRMLMPIFPPLVLRCAVCVLLELAFVLLVALVIRYAGKKKVARAVADIVTVERDENEPVPIEGPDLVLAHKLRNASVSQREEILRRAEAGEPLDEPEPAAKPEPEQPDEPAKEDLTETKEADPDEL